MANAQQDLRSPYELGNGDQTATYEETIAYFRKLDAAFETISMIEVGMTDAGLPLHLVTFNPDKDFDFDRIRKNKAILLLNNGIHPGEPDGIDATMMLFRDLATGKIAAPKNVVIANIAVYNIGGALNRNSHSRANQNGPEAYGFRGNARNYDLNRDFVKQDTRDALAFAEIFQKVQPDLFIDNHVSNGADYQYVFTYIETQPQKLGGALGQYWKTDFLPRVLDGLQARGFDHIPYVNVHDEMPDKGFEQFMDYARYSTGYAALFQTPGSMPETHMLKPYAQRVDATYAYMVSSLAHLEQNHKQLRSLRGESFKDYAPGKTYTLAWEIDKSKAESLRFLGYEGGYKTSAISGQPRLYYDRSKPFDKQIPYYATFKPKVQVSIPKAYVIPKAWWTVVEKLKANGVQMEQLTQDQTVAVESYRLGDFRTASSAYEGHYPHQDVSVIKTNRNIPLQAGDWIVKTNQRAVRYIVEMLEPQGVDSFFAWNFFDAVLQQKEYFSAYVFEDLAADLLKSDSSLKQRFEAKKQQDAAFAKSGEAQLDWIYQHSPYYEKTHLEYPVYRITH